MTKLSVDQALTKAKSHKKRGEVAEAQQLIKGVLKSFPRNKRAQKELFTLSNPKQINISDSLSQKEKDLLFQAGKKNK